MTPCTVPTGFFLLGLCGRASVASCAQCGRAVCGEHQEADGLCPECLAARSDSPPGPFDKGWSRRYRRDYYERIENVYDDGGWYSRLDAYDRGAFDPGDSHGGDDLIPDDDTSFVDS
ncbi:hypothetical protein [Thermomonospora echinospora]|uniref:hypothetical protein n=1 Tax=Thermomonospora echinospora TaxID=1992 RepID=UPI001F407C11|nr:hypothetical protein [Thermomonospora echinospora]